MQLKLSLRHSLFLKIFFEVLFNLVEYPSNDGFDCAVIDRFLELKTVQKSLELIQEALFRKSFEKGLNMKISMMQRYHTEGNERGECKKQGKWNEESGERKK